MKHVVSVPASPSDAFEQFTSHMAEWWPPEYTWAGETLHWIGIEPEQGGKCYELGPHGFRVDWGRVLECQPPDKIVFSWQISPRREPVPDPDRASRVEVTLTPAREGGCSVELTHSGFEAHGEAAEQYEAALAGDEGWPYILDRFAASLRG